MVTGVDRFIGKRRHNVGRGHVRIVGGLKNALRPGEKLLAVASGLFGEGFAAMEILKEVLAGGISEGKIIRKGKNS